MKTGEKRRRKGMQPISAFFLADITVCLMILALLTVSFISAYDRPALISRTLVKVICLLSSSIGFTVAGILIKELEYFGGSVSGAVSYLNITASGGVIHSFCAVALIYFQTSTWGMLPVMSGTIYRNYGYVHLINGIFYFVLFFGFLICIRPSSGRKKAR